MRIEDIQFGDRYRKDLGAIDALAQSIAEIGLLHPVVVTPDGLLIAGARRLAACKLLGWQEIPATVVDLHDIVCGEHDENVFRKDFTPSEAVAIGKALEPLEREAARERQRSHTPTGYVNFTDAAPALDRVASAVGMSRPTYQKAKTIIEAEEAEPEIYSGLVEQMDRTGNVNGAFRELKTREIAERPRVALPKGVYSVVYADPPWAFANSGFAQSAAAIYPTMPVSDICAMPIRSLCADDSVLFLWAPNALLPDGLAVMAAWGFEYKTNMVWCKERAPGMGWFTQSRHEMLLIGTRGSFYPAEKPTSWIVLPQGAHSAKPLEFYGIIESMYPASSRVELFARVLRAGWEAWGNEV